MNTTSKSKMLSATELLKQKLQEIKIGAKEQAKANYITQEFQDYGMRLAHRLDDVKHKSIYIRLAKLIPRAIIEDAASFVSDYPKAKDKGKIFMWKYRQLLGEYKAKHPEFKLPTTKKATAKKKLKKNGAEKEKQLKNPAGNSGNKAGSAQSKLQIQMQDNYKLL